MINERLSMQEVTISVITYNSSRFVLDTLESIKAQTYPNLILHVCDDCSTDNTVEICRGWIERNRDRFVSTDIIIPDHNTGVTANSNRAWDACTTKYHKGIAGDDILLPNCIADNMAYVEQNPDAVLIFSRMKSFGTDRAKCKKSDEETYRYEFFEWTAEEQARYLYDKGCCIPAPTCFVNVDAVRQVGLRHDERIPMQEDVAKWMNALKLGISFSFFDKVTVRYRIHDGSLSTATISSPKSRESCALFWFYYHFVPEYQKDPDKAIKMAVAQQMNYYKMFYHGTNPIVNSRRYRLMTAFFRPFDNLRDMVKGFVKK